MTKKQKDGDGVAPDPFDPAALRLSQDFGAEIGVQKVLIKVPVRKPVRQAFFRVHPDPAFSLDTAVIDLKIGADRDVYLVAPELRPQLVDEIVAIRLFTVIDRQGTVTLWPCRLAGPDGRLNTWYETALQAAELAKSRWIRITADQSLGGYQPHAASGALPEPEWPDVTFEELLKLAFKDRYIDSLDHPVVKTLRGLV
jgi:hypothetical protein